MKNIRTHLLITVAASLLLFLTTPLAAQDKPIEYFNLGGTVFGAQYPLEEFSATLIYNYSDIYIALAKKPFDTLGYYYFMNLSNGNYMVKAEPEYAETYVPTYFGNTLHWQEAAIIELFSDQYTSDIQLIEAQGIPPGAGNITGSVNMVGAGSGKVPVPDLEILLLSTGNDPLAYRLTNVTGYFEFLNMAWGTYVLYPEMEGKVTTPFLVTIDGDHPAVAVEFTMTEGEIFTGFEPVDDLSNFFTEVYPNPVTDVLHIDHSLNEPVSGSMQILDLSGRRIMEQSFEFKGTGQISIDCRELAAGIYFLRFSPENMSAITRKFSVSR